mmetsp:Transcript_67422/g.186864  ORF Transcript_67422/g.186864 Transcript_67422/m.186864 type:complete len:250 (-) Transcript_67422:1124-1873(-)
MHGLRRVEATALHGVRRGRSEAVEFLVWTAAAELHYEAALRDRRPPVGARGAECFRRRPGMRPPHLRLARQEQGVGRSAIHFGRFDGPGPHRRHHLHRALLFRQRPPGHWWRRRLRGLLEDPGDLLCFGQRTAVPAERRRAAGAGAGHAAAAREPGAQGAEGAEETRREGPCLRGQRGHCRQLHPAGLNCQGRQRRRWWDQHCQGCSQQPHLAPAQLGGDAELRGRRDAASSLPPLRLSAVKLSARVGP